MPSSATGTIEPRKTPVQARSAASVGAILEATVQVLVKDGLEKLTTTRVAARAGVSVGTLYQYFPNKKALLHSLLEDKLASVSAAIEAASASVHGATLAHMADTLAAAFVAAKFRNPHVSVALYSASEDLEGRQLARAGQLRASKAMAAAFATACDRQIAEPQRVAAFLFSAIAGISRATLESGTTKAALPALQGEIALLMRSYLEASGTPARGAAHE